ncbi:MAG TPA: hypothetical protein VH333_25090 [Pseudonocardiaceae bacterium]|nr:hypothetical protein [Pseudonocardiaceae bacterium]
MGGRIGVGHPEVGQHLDHPGVQPDAALLDQPHQHGRGVGLGDRADLEQRVDGRGRTGAGVRHPVANSWTASPARTPTTAPGVRYSAAKSSNRRWLIIGPTPRIPLRTTACHPAPPEPEEAG